MLNQSTRTHQGGMVTLLMWLLFSAPAWGAASPARTLLNENRLEEANLICRQFEVLSTIDIDNFLACAWVYLRSDNLDGAARFMEKIRKSGVASGELQLLTIYFDIKNRRYEQARLALNKFVEEQRGTPLGPAAQEVSAELYEMVGQADTAAFIYKQVVADDPARARAHWGLGRYYLSRGDTARARTHLLETAKSWPKHVGSRYNLAIMLLQEGDVTEAARLLGQCYKINKSDPGVLEQLGNVLEKRGNLPEALKFWRKALSIQPDSSIAKEKLNSFGVSAIDALIDSGQYEQALTQINSLGKVVAQQPPFQLRRAIVLRYMQKYDAALTTLLGYLRTNPRDSVAIREMGICYSNQKKWDRAQQAFSHAIEMDPSDGLNHAWLAYVFETKKHLPEARGEWALAVRYLKESADLTRAKRRLASVESKIGKAPEPKESDDSHANPPPMNPAPDKGMWESNPQNGAQVPQ